MTAEGITVTVRELCGKILPGGNIDMRRGAFRIVESKRLRKLLQKKGGAVYTPDISLEKDFECGTVNVRLTGCADGVIQTEEMYIVDEIFCVNVPAESLQPFFCKTHTAQVMCLAYMYASAHGLSKVGTRLTYCEAPGGESVKFDRVYGTEELGEYVENLVGVYAAQEEERILRKKRFESSAGRLTFPYRGYREGQRTLCEYVLEAVCTGKKLYAEAPTGIGKTASVLFPAIKAMSGGYGSKIFYFTSKTTIAKAARDAFVLMCEKGLEASYIILSARERLCPGAPDRCNPDCCEYACGHFDRITAAVSDAAADERFFDAETVEKYARRHRVCPYELSLALSERCELVICDYNYLFDPKVYLRRYFTEKGDYIFLIDEAHNLGERARDMYTARIKSGDIEAALLALSPEDRILYPKAAAVLSCMKSAVGLMEIKSRREGRTGAYVTERAFAKFNSRLEELASAVDSYIRFYGGSDSLEQLYSEIKSYLAVSKYYDEKFVSAAEYRNGEITFRQICVDPSGVISLAAGKGRSAVFFSATLSPPEYFKSVLGAGERDLYLTLPSPFPRENLCLCATYKFSTRLDDRNNTASALANMLYTFISAKSGNYIVFFPSYKYMGTVYGEFTKRYPGVRTMVQKSTMSAAEREEFIKSFDRTTEKSGDGADGVKRNSEILRELLGSGIVRASELLGKTGKAKYPKDGRTNENAGGAMLAFGVLGGAFAEGVDYAGDKLIGCAVVGVGLPTINDESNLICEYYNKKSADEYAPGYDYAYRIPGMIKVLQAAGRVIRSENDRGAVLLIDDRFARPEYTRFYPAHWKHMRLIGDSKALGELLRRFYGNSGAGSDSD